MLGRPLQERKAMKKTFEVIKTVLTWLIVLLAVCMMVFTIVSVTTFDRNDRALFGSRDGNRISVSAVHRLVKKALLQAGLDATELSAHKLRHTAATMMLSGGVDVRTVQEVLGHENLNTTQIYTHIESTELKIAAQANPLSHLDFSKKE